MATVQMSENPDNKTLTISIKGRFDFGTHKEFRAAYNERNGVFSTYIVNMKEVEYIDSSALGMLLLLREHVMSCGGKLVIAGSNPEISKILKIANFDKLFVIQ